AARRNALPPAPASTPGTGSATAEQAPPTTAEQPPATTAKPTPPPTTAEPQASAPEGQGNEAKAGESPLEAAQDRAVTPPPDATPAAPPGARRRPLPSPPSEPPSSSNLILDKQLLTTRIKEALAGEHQHKHLAGSSGSEVRPVRGGGPRAGHAPAL